MGEAVRQKLAALRQYQPIGIEIGEINFQPEAVSAATSEFMFNLAKAVGIVVVVLLFAVEFPHHRAGRAGGLFGGGAGSGLADLELRVSCLPAHPSVAVAGRFGVAAPPNRIWAHHLIGDEASSLVVSTGEPFHGVGPELAGALRDALEELLARVGRLS